eukprot:gene19904-biopygen23518
MRGPPVGGGGPTPGPQACPPLGARGATVLLATRILALQERGLGGEDAGATTAWVGTRAAPEPSPPTCQALHVVPRLLGVPK